MNLRPHHALCIQNFRGHGYSDAFTAHMTNVTALLSETPQTLIAVTKGCDELCGCCPHNVEGRCATLQKVSDMDEGVLTFCGLAYGETIPWAYFAALARERILETGKFEKICGCCEWFKLCKSIKIGTNMTRPFGNAKGESRKKEGRST